MSQTTVLHHTPTDTNVPALLKAGQIAVGVGPTNTRLWFGDGAANRLVLSSNPGDAPIFNLRNYLSLSGGTLSGGLSFGSTYASGVTDLSRHISLFGTNYGFSATANRLNAVAGAAFYFNVAGSDRMSVEAGGLYIIGANDIILSRPPSAPMQATTKQYVDTSLGNYLPLAGGTISGPINWVGPPTAGTNLATKSYVDAAVAASSQFQGTWDVVNNVPPLDIIVPLNGQYWIASSTGNAPAGVPGIGGQLVSSGDSVIYEQVMSGFTIVSSGGITQAQADARYLQLIGGNITGSLGVANNISVGGGITYAGGNLIAFHWTGSQLEASVDNTGTPGVLATGAELAAYLPLGGGQMTGQILLLPPTSQQSAVTKDYVDSQVGALRLFVSTWQVAANSPPLTGAESDGDYYLAVTATPSISETAPAGIPGIGGQTINNGDMVIWDTNSSIYQLVRGSPLNVAEANALYAQLTGAQMTGPLLLAGNANAALEPVPLQQLNSTLGNYLPLSGGTTSGPLQVNPGAATGQPAQISVGGQGISYVAMGAIGDNISLAVSGGQFYVFQNGVALPTLAQQPWVTANYMALGGGQFNGSIGTMPFPGGTSGQVFTGALVVPGGGSLDYNIYVDNAATPRFLGAGFGAQSAFDASIGSFTWAATTAAGATDAPATTRNLMALDAAGDLSLTIGNLQVAGGVLIATTLAGVNFWLSEAGGNRILNWAPNYSDYWDGVTGSRCWTSPSGVTMTLGFSGGLEIISDSATKLNGGPWIGVSDERVKKDVADYSAGLDEICRLRPISFKYNGLGNTADNGKTYYGLIAQEARGVMPEIIFNLDEPKMSPQRKDGMLEGQLGMDAGPLTFALLNAVRELRDMVIALSAPAREA